MPIPPFDGILNVLPPHTGRPHVLSELSPYVCSMSEVCDRFATSPARKAILEGFLDLRKEFRSLGIEGFQWLDGSFSEDIEASEGRDPGDIDVVTFVAQPNTPNDVKNAFSPRPELLQQPDVKSRFHVDHYLVPLGSQAEVVVEHTRYWYGLFSHRRDCTWKGMLRVDLSATCDDDAARVVLRNKP